ncbi:MAG: zinc-ribbon domain-containing protein [Clostridiales bacterium]|nr:zinc-ribbon domain-containing protein [Clostridiales bacterium]
MARYCENCGAELSENAKFCSNCGVSVTGENADNSAAAETNDGTFTSSDAVKIAGTVAGVAAGASLLRWLTRPRRPRHPGPGPMGGPPMGGPGGPGGPRGGRF